MKVPYRILDYTPSPHPNSIFGSASQKPSHLSLFLSLPPQSITTLTLDVELSFLRYTQYVPDAQRGIDIPGGVLRVLPKRNTSVESIRIYTPPLLISLPTPDFSMPYNVIMMTSTVVGFMAATTLNNLIRRCVWVKVD